MKQPPFLIIGISLCATFIIAHPPDYAYEQRSYCGQSDGGVLEIKQLLACTCAEIKCQDWHDENTSVQKTLEKMTQHWDNCKNCIKECDYRAGKISNTHNRKLRAQAAASRCKSRYDQV